MLVSAPFQRAKKSWYAVRLFGVVAREGERDRRQGLHVSAIRERERGMRLLLCQNHVTDQRFAYGGRGLVGRSDRFFMRAFRGGNRIARQSAGLSKLRSLGGS